MRTTRYERNRRNRARRSALILLLFLVPVTAVAASLFFMNIYIKGSSVEASADGSASGIATAFKYNYELKSKTLYRVELKSTDSFEEAEAFIKIIKSGKLNGFILKENGYKVIYGIFTGYDEAASALNRIAGKTEGAISEFSLPGYSLKYNGDDSTFIQLVQAADKLIWEDMKVKSGVTAKMLLGSMSDSGSPFTAITEIEDRLQKYLGYVQEIEVSNYNKAFQENFILLLKNILTYRVENNGNKDYYRIQEGLLNQIEAYRRFAEGLSV